MEAIRRMRELLAPVEPEIVIWSFLWDPLAVVPFDTMGLFDAGTDPSSPAWDAWRNPQPP